MGWNMSPSSQSVVYATQMSGTYNTLTARGGYAGHVSQ